MIPAWLYKRVPSRFLDLIPDDFVLYNVRHYTDRQWWNMEKEVGNTYTKEEFPNTEGSRSQEEDLSRSEFDRYWFYNDDSNRGVDDVNALVVSAYDIRFVDKESMPHNPNGFATIDLAENAELFFWHGKPGLDKFPDDVLAKLGDTVI